MLHEGGSNSDHGMSESIQPVEVMPVTEKITRIPVEVIAKGSAPEWVYVNVGSQAVPEPGTTSLIVLASVLLAFRRQRQ